MINCGLDVHTLSHWPVQLCCKCCHLLQRLAPDISERLNASLAHLELELQKICQVCGINSTFQYDPSQITQSQEEVGGHYYSTLWPCQSICFNGVTGPKYDGALLSFCNIHPIRNCILQCVFLFKGNYIYNFFSVVDSLRT